MDALNAHPAPGPAELSRHVRDWGLELGFELVGITPAVTPAGFSHLCDWIAEGHHGQMQYIPRRKEAYANPGLVLEGARSVVALGLNYHAGGAGDVLPGVVTPGEPRPESTSTYPGRVARYALGRHDYHHVIRGRLQQFVRRLRHSFPGMRARGVVDTAPVLERDYGRAAGLGWFGKNTMLIHKRLGSWFFLAAVLLDVELEYDLPHDASHCGTCTACLDVCPTDAFVAPYVLDARRCISYLTIELKGSIEPELRPGIGNWLFGCDLCQEVCPWNRKSPVTPDPAFQPRADPAQADALAILDLNPTEFEERFGNTPLARPGREGLRRNAVIVLANSGDPGLVPRLAALRQDADPVVRGTAAWGLGQLTVPESHAELERWQQQERDPAVIREIAAAIRTLELRDADGKQGLESLSTEA